MNIVRFEMNVPMEVALQSSEGVSVAGRYGTRKMFTLTDGRVMYVPPTVAGKIEAAGIAPSECFQLCKASVKTGQRRSVEWMLERSPEKDRPPAAECETNDTETPLEQDLRRSVEMVTAQRSGIKSGPSNCVEPIPPFIPPGNGHVSGNGSVPNVATSSAPATKLEHALKTAISAAHNAEKFGSELGYVVRFDADAIKSMAITVLINMSERATR